MKPSLANLPTPQRRRETRTLTSALQEGLQVTVTLEAPGPIQRGDMGDLYQRYLQRYVKGRPAGEEGPPLVPSKLAVEGGSVQLNENLCGQLAWLEVMQPKTTPEGAAIPTEERLELAYLGLLLVKVPDLWDELIVWAYDLLGTPYAAGNSPAPDAASSSGAVSPSTPGTLTSCSTEPTATGVPTPASEPCLGGVLNIPVSSAASTPEWGPGSSLPA